MEGDGKLCPLEIKKTATPDKCLTRVFGVIDKAPLQRGTGVALYMADKLSAFDRKADRADLDDMKWRKET